MTSSSPSPTTESLPMEAQVAAPLPSVVLKPRARWITWTGISCIILSFALYGFFFLVPLLPVDGVFKTVLAVGSVIGGEALFWVGGLALGVQFVRRFRRYLNPVNWFRRVAKPTTSA